MRLCGLRSIVPQVDVDQDWGRRETNIAAYSNRELIRRMLSLAWLYRWGCIRIVALQATLLGFGMLGLGLMGVGVDYIRFRVAGQAAGTAASVAKPPHWPLGLQPPDDWSPAMVIGAIAAAILAFAAVRSFLSAFYTVAVNILLQGRIVVDLRARVFAKLQRLSFRFFDANASSTIINRVTGDVQSVRSFVDGVMIQSLILVISLCVYVAYMATIHARLTLACLATTPLLWIVTAMFSRRVRPAYVKASGLFDEQVRSLVENIQGIHVVKGFARQHEEIAKFDRASDAVRDQKRWIFRQTSIFNPVITMLTQINLVVLLGYGGYLVVCHERAPDVETAAYAGISVGNLLVFAGLLQQFSGQVGNIATIADSMQMSLTGAQRVFELLDTPVEIDSRPDAARLRGMRGEVQFENVEFRYKPDDVAIENISFTVKQGQCVAILGATGSGKSTLLSLIPRFYDPTRGRILVDGRDVRELNLEDLRRGIGMVFQENFLFSNTVRANIAFGAPDATHEQVEHAARLAAAHDFIVQMPQGYDTLLHEGGSNLSGGQRQRLAIARAILLKPAILLMDDPTAAIDAGTEADIMRAMDNAMDGRTTFLVAHKLSALRRADIVIVLDRGRIVQIGTHEELMNTKGYYRRAAHMQIADDESLRILRGNGSARS